MTLCHSLHNCSSIIINHNALVYKGLIVDKRFGCPSAKSGKLNELLKSDDAEVRTVALEE